MNELNKVFKKIFCVVRASRGAKKNASTLCNMGGDCVTSVAH